MKIFGAALVALVLDGTALAQTPKMEFKARTLGDRLRVEGTSSLPDRSLLRMNLSHLEERTQASGIHPVEIPEQTSFVEQKGQTFSMEIPLTTPGQYRVAVEYGPEDQPEEATARQPVSVSQEVKGWRRDEHFPRFAGFREEMDQHRAKILELIDEFERVSSDETSWNRESKALIEKSNRILKTLEESKPARVFTAAAEELKGVIRMLTTLTHYLKFDPATGQGEFYDYHINARVKTQHEEEFDFEKLRRYARNTVDIVARERRLIFLADLRFSLQSTDPSELRKSAEAIAKIEENLEEFLKELQSMDAAGALERIAAFEEKIRSGK